MKPYEKYKDSGLNFLEKIPEKWRVQKIKFFVNIYNGDSLNDDYKIQFESYNLDDLAYISSKDIDVDNSKVKYENGLRIPKDFGKFKIAPTNSTLICIEGGSAGKKIAFTNQPVHFVNKLACLNTINGESSKFLYYSLKANLFQSQFKNSIAGLIGGVSISNLKNFYLTIPTLQEQTAIAQYLDHQTAIIDELIEKKTKQIALLKEKRQAIINETVTKGLDPTAKMKDSGVSWLGEIPASWEVTRLRYLGKCQNGVSQGSEYFGSGDPFVNYSDVYKNIALPQSVSGLAKSTDADKENYSVIEGDIFFTRTSETVEEIGLSSICLNTIENAVFAGFLIRFRPKPNILDKDFSKYYFRSHIQRVYFVKEMNLVTRASLSQELLKSLPVLLPSLKEQKELATFLDSQVEKMNNAMLDIESAVQKLKEYRQSLISEAVTGKIDVRSWQK
jgi:type I restriction enzyme S subunit